MSNPPHEHAVPVRPRAFSAALRARHSLTGRLAGADPSARFLTPQMAAAIVLYLLVTISLASYSVNNDGRVYLDFMRHLTGESTTASSTQQLERHQFGSALFTLPFFLVARVLGLLGVHSLNGAPLEQLSMVAATTVALLLTVYLGWRLLRRLELPAGAWVLALTVVGTPLFYYAVFQPTYKHTIDTMFAMLAAVLLLRALERPSRGVLLALGACLALSILTRTANLAVVPGILLPLLLRRNVRGAAVVVTTTVAVALALLAVPRAAGVPGAAPALPRITFASSDRLAASDLVVANFYWCRDTTYHLTFKQCIHNKLGIWPDPAAPAKMLFTLHRGLFVWTPLTALAAVGFVLLVRRRRDLRDYLFGLGVAAVGLWLVHMLWGDFWDNGFSFSQRFLTALFPVFLLGTAELVRRWRAGALTALSLCAAFSLVLALTFFVGYKGIGRDDGVDRMVRLYSSGERTPQQLVRRVGVQARGRWLGH